MERESQRRKTWVAAAVFAALAMWTWWLREPGLHSQGFASHDVAGITYNAQLILDGALPYRDSVELKAPGSFYLAALIAPEGRGIGWVQQLHTLANVWAMCTALALMVFAWRSHAKASKGEASPARAWTAVWTGVAYLAFDAHLDSMDANYVTWANLPTVFAVWWTWEGGARGAQGKWRARWRWWVAAGLAAGLAALFKRPAAVVGPAIFVWAAVFAPGEAKAKQRMLGLACIAGGVLLAHLPIALHFASQGALGDFVRGYALNAWGAKYIGAREVGGIAALREGVLASAHFVGPVLGAALFAAFAPTATREGGSEDDEALRHLLVLWMLGTWAATAVGLRFYKGYFSTALAPMALLAAMPWGLRRFFGGGVRTGVLAWAARGLVLAWLCLGLARQVSISKETRRDRAHPHDLGSRAIAAHIAPRLEPGDRIWVWGWHLWDVYTYADARAGSRIYKSLGLLTPPNDDTWRTPATPPRFVDGPMAELLLEDFRATPPRWIVLGSNAPAREFKALQLFLRSHYRRDRSLRLNRVQFWERREATAPPG